MKADVGILLVHGVGNQRQGQTLHQFGSPLIDMINEGTARLKATDVSESKCNSRCMKDEHRHVHVVGESHSEDWLVSECHWNNLVTEVDASKFNRWILPASMVLVVWQLAASVRSTWRRRPKGRPLSLFAYFYAGLCRVAFAAIFRYYLLLVAISASLFLNLSNSETKSTDGRLAGALNRVDNLREIVLRNTIGDAFAFTMTPAATRAILSSYRSSFQSLQARSRTTIVIAHSQGAAIMRDANEEYGLRPSQTVSVGSGAHALSAIRCASLDQRWSTVRCGTGSFISLVAWALVGTVAAWTITLILLIGLIVVLGILTTFLSIFAFLLTLLTTESASAAYSRTTSVYTEGFAGTDVNAILHSWAFVLVSGAITNILTLLMALFLGWIATRFFGMPRLSATTKSLRTESPSIELYSPLDPVTSGCGLDRHSRLVRTFNPVGVRIFKEHTSYFGHTHATRVICNAVLSISRFQCRLPVGTYSLSHIRGIVIQNVPVVVISLYAGTSIL